MDYIFFRKCFMCVACGFMFGIVLHRSTVLDPNVIRRQMLFQELTLIKFYLSALSTSMFAMSLLAMIPQTSRMFKMATNDYFNRISVQSIKTRSLGDVLSGIGVTLAGSCPVTIFAQVGAQMPNSGYVLFGILVTFFVIASLRSSYIGSKPCRSKNPWHNSPYFMLSLPIVAMFGILVCAFETLIPFEIDSSVASTSNKETSSIFSYPWYPHFSGVLLGVLQMPMIVFVQRTLGGFGDGLDVAVTHVYESSSPNIKVYQDGWLQLLFMGGVISGGFISSNQFDLLSRGQEEKSIRCILGGILMTIGGEIGGGCIINNGLTGMALLSIQSLLSIMVTFVSASLTCFLLLLI